MGVEEWGWQARTLRALAVTAAADEDITEIWTYGPAGAAEPDEWSDLDVALVAPRPEALTVAEPVWSRLSVPVWAYQAAGGASRGGGVRVVGTGGERINVSVVGARAELPEDARRVEEHLEGAEVVGFMAPGGAPVATGTGVDDPVPAAGEQNGRPSDRPAASVPQAVNEFRFTAARAVVEAARNDLLLGGHLALELPRSCLALAIRLRELGADPAGFDAVDPADSWNEILERALDVVPDAAAGRSGILDLVDASAGLFDELAALSWPDYVADWSGLTALLDRARSGLRPLPAP